MEAYVYVDQPALSHSAHGRSSRRTLDPGGRPGLIGGGDRLLHEAFESSVCEAIS